MSLMNQNPLLPNSSNNGSNYNYFGRQMPNVSPQEWEYIQSIRRTGWQDPNIQQQPTQQLSDPYTDFETEFSKCSTTVQNKILNDSEFKKSMEYCDRLMQGAIESIVRPQVIQTPEGRIAFERMLATFRSVKDKYTEEEIKSMERLNKIMQDEVVQKRLAELEKESGDK